MYFLKNTKLFMRVSQHAGIFVLFLLVWFGIFLFVCFSGKKMEAGKATQIVFNFFCMTDCRCEECFRDDAWLVSFACFWSSQ